MVTLRNLLILLFLMGCGAQLDYSLKRAPVIDKGELSGTFLFFSTVDSSGNELLFDNSSSKKTLLIFSGQYCFSCVQETERFIASLNDPAVAPSKINVITLVVLAEIIDADDFKFFNGVPWTVGIDKDQSIVKKYCGTTIVPCLVINDPVTGIFLAHTGTMELDELKELTGAWE